MLSLIEKISGRPWAIDQRVATQVRLTVLRDGFAALRQFADIKRAAHAYQDDERHDRVLAARGEGRRMGGSVALIRVLGTLTQRGDVIDSVETRSTAMLAAEVEAAIAEPRVDGVVLEFDSPGGEVYGVPEAWAAIRAAAKEKPIVAHANSLMASAALYLGSAATELWVTPSGEVGSVGVYALHVDVSKALEEMGERWEFIEADDSPHKVEGNPAAPLSGEARSQIKKSVNRYMAMFVRDLAKGRNVTEHHVRERFGKGRMLGPQEAVSAKMADGVGTIDHAIRRIGEIAAERRRASAIAPPAAVSDPPEPMAAVQKPAPAEALPADDGARAAALQAMRRTL